MPNSIRRKVEEWATKDGGFCCLQSMDQNNNEFEFRNENYDESLVKEKIVPFPAIFAEFPVVDLGRDTTGKINPPVVSNDGNDDIQRQAMIAARKLNTTKMRLWMWKMMKVLMNRLI